MKPKAFWRLAAFAALIVTVIGLIGYGAVWWFGAETTQPYKDCRAAAARYDAWYAERNLDPRQVRFDEALAGRASTDSIADPPMRVLAENVRTLALGESDVNSRAKIVSSLFIHDGVLGIRRWVSCNNDHCWMKPVAASLGNSERLAVLLGTDEAAKRAALPIVPDEFRQRPAWNGGAKKRWPLLERSKAVPPEWRWIGAWLAISTLFGTAFFLVGYSRHRSNAGGRFGKYYERAAEEHPNPFATVPHFLLGWIVYLAMLPGVILMQALRFVTFDAQPALRKAKNAVLRRTFASEYERTLARLEEMRAKAAAHEQSEDTLRMIDATIKKVKEAQNLEELDKLRRVAMDIQCAYEAKIEIEQALNA